MTTSFTLNDNINKVLVAGHQGPHPEKYHRIVYDRLLMALRSAKTKDDCSEILKKTLNSIAEDINTQGSELNKLITK